MCAIIVAGNGLHPLVQTDDNHNDEKYQTIGDAIPAYCYIASKVGFITVLRQTAGDEDCHEAGTEIYQKLR